MCHRAKSSALLSLSKIIFAPASTVIAFAIRTGVTLIPFRRPPLRRFRPIEYRLRRGAELESRTVRLRRRLPPPRARLAFARFLKAAARAFADIRRFFRATPVAG